MRTQGNQQVSGSSPLDNKALLEKADKKTAISNLQGVKDSITTHLSKSSSISSTSPVTEIKQQALKLADEKLGELIRFLSTSSPSSSQIVIAEDAANAVNTLLSAKDGLAIENAAIDVDILPSAGDIQSEYAPQPSVMETSGYKDDLYNLQEAKAQLKHLTDNPGISREEGEIGGLQERIQNLEKGIENDEKFQRSFADETNLTQYEMKKDISRDMAPKPIREAQQKEKARIAEQQRKADEGTKSMKANTENFKAQLAAIKNSGSETTQKLVAKASKGPLSDAQTREILEQPTQRDRLQQALDKKINDKNNMQAVNGEMGGPPPELMEKLNTSIVTFTQLIAEIDAKTSPAQASTTQSVQGQAKNNPKAAAEGTL